MLYINYLKLQPLKFTSSLISNDGFITQCNLQNLHNKGFLKVALGSEPIVIAPWCFVSIVNYKKLDNGGG
jgi:hypothetical protein